MTRPRAEHIRKALSSEPRSLVPTVIGASAALVGYVALPWLRMQFAGLYGALGSTPEELGIGYIDILLRSVFAMFFALGPIFALTVWTVLNRTQVPGTFKQYSTSRQGLAAAVVVIWMLGFLFFLAGRVTTLESVARSGGTVTTVDMVPFGSLIDIVIRPARVIWATDPALTSTIGRCEMFLGESGGKTILYDPRHEEAIRVPGNLVVVAVDQAATSC